MQNVKGVTKAATVSAMVVASGNIGGAIGGQIYRPNDAPLFKTGHAVNACLLFVCLLCIVGIKAMNKYSSKFAVQADDVTE